jgi:hypothetical protein
MGAGCVAYLHKAFPVDQLIGAIGKATRPPHLERRAHDQRVAGCKNIQNENPFLDGVIAPFCRSISGSGLYLPGIYKSAGSLEARLRI